MCIVCASVECIIWNNFRQKRLRPASDFSQPLSTRVLDTPIIFPYLLIFIFIKTYCMLCTSPSQRFIQCTKYILCKTMMAHLHWFILCGLSSASVPSQSRSNPPTDPAPRPSDWCLRGVENYAASISISHHLLKLQLIQLHLAPSAPLLSSNSLKLQPMLCACSVISVVKDFSSLSDVTWYSVHCTLGCSVLPQKSKSEFRFYAWGAQILTLRKNETPYWQ